MRFLMNLLSWFLGGGRRARTVQVLGPPVGSCSDEELEKVCAAVLETVMEKFASRIASHKIFASRSDGKIFFSCTTTAVTELEAAEIEGLARRVMKVLPGMRPDPGG